LKSKRLVLSKRQLTLLGLTKPKSLSESKFLNLMVTEGLCKYAVHLVEMEESKSKKFKLIGAVVSVSKEVIKENIRLLRFKKRLVERVEQSRRRCK